MADSDKAVYAVKNEHFLARVEHFMVKGAVAIVGEGAVAGHTERLAYALTILGGTADVLQMARGVMTNSTILTNTAADGGTSSVTDSDLEFTVNSLLNDYAGYDG